MHKNGFLNVEKECELQTYHSHIANMQFAYCRLTIHILFSPFQEDAVELCLLRFLRGEVNFLHRQIRAKKISLPVMIGKGDFKI